MADYTLITGATSGIGEELAISLSATHQIVLCGRNAEKLESVRNKCTNPSGHLILCFDLQSDKDSLFDLTNEFLTGKNIAISSFVHAAGITRILPLKNFTPDFVSEIFNINLFSSIEILRALMKKENKGALRNVVFISALWSIRGDKGNSIYAASKGAINSLVISLARELAPKVRVNSVVPGAVITPMTQNRFEDESFRKLIENDYPLGLGYASDIVNLTEFLLSDKARWITGQNLVIDGGRSTK